MEQHDCTCKSLTREDTLELAYDLLLEGAEQAEQGRPAEASVLNALAQTAIALTERIPANTFMAPIH